MTTCAIAGGMDGRWPDTSPGASVTCAASTACGVGPMNGGRPVRSSYAMAPTA
jgi:hypothetical protein